VSTSITIAATAKSRSPITHVLKPGQETGIMRPMKPACKSFGSVEASAVNSCEAPMLVDGDFSPAPTIVAPNSLRESVVEEDLSEVDVVIPMATRLA
jgi:hypothetical protein